MGCSVSPHGSPTGCFSVLPLSAEEWAETSSARGLASSLPSSLVSIQLVKKSVYTCMPLFYCVLIGCGPGALFSPAGFLRVTLWYLPGSSFLARGRLKANCGLKLRGNRGRALTCTGLQLTEGFSAPPQ